MKSKKVNKNVIMMIIVLFITLGYAYLNSNLRINGTTGIAGNTWDDTGRRYSHFNITDKEISKTHDRLGESKRLPKCNYNTYTY